MCVRIVSVFVVLCTKKMNKEPENDLQGTPKRRKRKDGVEVKQLPDKWGPRESGEFRWVETICWAGLFRAVNGSRQSAGLVFLEL